MNDTTRAVAVVIELNNRILQLEAQLADCRAPTTRQYYSQEQISNIRKESEVKGAEKLIKMLHSEDGALGYEYTYLLEEFQARQKEGVK